MNSTHQKGRIANTAQAKDILLQDFTTSLRQTSSNEQKQLNINNRICCEKQYLLSSSSSASKCKVAKKTPRGERARNFSQLQLPSEADENLNYVNETTIQDECFDVDKNNDNNNNDLRRNDMTAISKKCNCTTTYAVTSTTTTTTTTTSVPASSKLDSIYHPPCPCFNSSNNHHHDETGAPISMPPQQLVVSDNRIKGKQAIGKTAATATTLGRNDEAQELQECELEGLKNHTTSVVSSSLIIATIPLLPPVLASSELDTSKRQVDDGINVDSTAVETNSNNNQSNYSGQGKQVEMRDTSSKGVPVLTGNESALMGRIFGAREISIPCNSNDDYDSSNSKGLKLSKNASNDVEISATVATTTTTNTTTTANSGATTTTTGTTISGVTSALNSMSDAKLASSTNEQSSNNKLPSASSNLNNYIPVENNEPPQMIRYLGSSMQVRSEQKATKVLGVVFFTFVICWTPFFVINFTQAFVERDELAKWISNEIMTTFLWLGYISSTINPVIYTVFNRNFRRAFRQLLLCRRVNHRYRFRSRNFELNRSFRMSQYGRQAGNGFNSSMYSAASRQQQNFNTKSAMIGQPQVNNHNGIGAIDNLRNNNNTVVGPTKNNGTTRNHTMLMLDENQVTKHHGHHQRSSSSNNKDSNEQSLMRGRGLEHQYQNQQQQQQQHQETVDDGQPTRKGSQRGLVKKLTKQSTLGNPAHQVRGVIRQALKSSSSLFSSFSTSLQCRDDQVNSSIDGKVDLIGTPPAERELSQRNNIDEISNLLPSNEVEFEDEKSITQAISCVKPSANIQRTGIMRSQQSSVKSNTLSQNLTATTRPKLSFVDQIGLG